MQFYDLVDFFLLIIASLCSVFFTSQDNVNINKTSSYVDLGLLYANNKEMVNKICTHVGRGMMLPGTFAEDHLRLLPPPICVLRVLFNWNQNVRPRKSNFTLVLNSSSVHRQQINERHMYMKPESIPLTDPDCGKKIADQDEDIFQTA